MSDEHLKLQKFLENLTDEGKLNESALQDIKNYVNSEADKGIIKKVTKTAKVIKFIVKVVIFIFALIILTAIYGMRYGTK